MKSDGGMLWYLLNKIRGGGVSNDRGNTPAFGFDGTNDYISSNATIGRTGYDMNVSGNVSTGSDGDGSYIQFNGNRLSGAGSNAFCGGSATPSYNQTNSFTIKAKVKINSLPPSGSTGIFGSNGDCGINTDSAGNDLFFGLNGSSSVLYTASAVFTLGVYFDAYLVYDATTSKFFCYFSSNGVASSLLNTGGTAGPATFTTDSWRVGDGGMTGTTDTSGPKFVYHAAIRNKALTQAEIDADIALGNTAKNDPSIVAYYIPDNLIYNTQYIANPKDLANASWVKLVGCTVAANTTVAPDGTTTADTVTFTAANNSQTSETVTAISGSTIASKTFIVKAFVKVAAGTKQFRLKCAHSGVSDYLSTDQTATTTWQEFTFTQTFTSSTSGTGIQPGVCNGSGAVAGDIQVRNVRVYLTNETLRDESPNIGGFIGWKTQKVLSCRVKPNSDPTNTPSSGGLIAAPWFYLQDRNTTHDIQCRYDNRIQSRTSTQSQGSGFRGKVHATGVFSWTGSVWQTRLYINGNLITTGNQRIDAPSGIVNTSMRLGRNSSTYFAANIRDARIYTFTGSFTDADALAIYNGGEPTSPGVTKYLHYKPLSGEIGTATSDLSGNLRDGTLNGGVTRVVV